MLGPGLNEHGRMRPLNEVLDNDRIKRAQSNQILGRAFDRSKIKRVLQRTKQAWPNQVLQRIMDLRQIILGRQA